MSSSNAFASHMPVPVLALDDELELDDELLEVAMQDAFLQIANTR